MKTLLALIIRLALLAVLTFGFVVLYEHGPSGFVAGASVEFRQLAAFVEERIGQSRGDAAPTPFREPDLPADPGGEAKPIAPES